MNAKRLILINTLIFIIIATASIGGYSYYVDAETYVQTEDAKVMGDIIHIPSANAGKLIDWKATTGKSYKKGEIIGQVKTADKTQNIVSPIDGTIVKSEANIGQSVFPGKPLAQIVDMNNLYIMANIEETEIGEVHLNQKVDVMIDFNEGSKLQGQVKEVGLATNSVFSLLPTEQVSGNYTKVVQRIPVKIHLDSYPKETVPGMNATVWIHK